jgi:hypothetical protein
VLLLGVIWDTMETMVLPRAAVRHWRLTRMFYRLTWAGWTGLARRTPWLSTLLSLYGPISLLVLLVFWAGMLVFGFGLVHWGLGAHYSMHDVEPGLPALLYYSGTTFFTLGLGDITPLSGPARVLSVLETGVGFGYLALVIGYLPVIYQSYSRRESVLSVLDARAGSPPTAAEMLRRTGQGHEPGSAFPGLEDDLRTW